MPRPACAAFAAGLAAAVYSGHRNAKSQETGVVPGLSETNRHAAVKQKLDILKVILAAAESIHIAARSRDACIPGSSCAG
jgi:hypothetical protein